MHSEGLLHNHSSQIQGRKGDKENGEDEGGYLHSRDAICQGQGRWSQAWGRESSQWPVPGNATGSCLSSGTAPAPPAPRPCSSGFSSSPVNPAHSAREPPALGRSTEAPSSGAQPHMGPWWDTAMEPVPPQHPSSIPSLPHRVQPHLHSDYPQPHRSIPASWSLPPTPQCLSSTSETPLCSTEPISSSSIHPKSCLGAPTPAGQFCRKPAWMTCLKNPCSHLHPGQPSTMLRWIIPRAARLVKPVVQDLPCKVTHIPGGAGGSQQERGRCHLGSTWKHTPQP